MCTAVNTDQWLLFLWLESSQTVDRNVLLKAFQMFTWVVEVKLNGREAKRSSLIIQNTKHNTEYKMLCSQRALRGGTEERAAVVAWRGRCVCSAGTAGAVSAPLCAQVLRTACSIKSSECSDPKQLQERKPLFLFPKRAVPARRAPWNNLSPDGCAFNSFFSAQGLCSVLRKDYRSGFFGTPFLCERRFNVRADECDPLSATKRTGENGMESALLPQLLTAVVAVAVMAAQPGLGWGISAVAPELFVISSRKEIRSQ